MLEAVTVLVAPDGRDDDRLRALRAAGAAYLHEACRPFLALPAADAARVNTHIVHFATRGHDARLRLLLTLDDWLRVGGEQAHGQLIGATREMTGRVLAAAAQRFHPDAAGSLGVGLRVAVGALRRLLANAGRFARATGSPESQRVVAELGQVTQWFDVASSAVCWFLRDPADWMTADIAETTAFAVKALGVRYAASLDLLLREPALVREPAAPTLALADLDWDVALADVASRALLEFIDGRGPADRPSATTRA